MRFHALLAFASALFSGGLALFILWEKRRLFVHWMFAAGMGTVACAAVLTGLSLQTAFSEQAIHWKWLSYLVTAFIPGSWLLFSLSFGHADYHAIVTQWKYGIGAMFAVPLVLVLLFPHALLLDFPQHQDPFVWLLSLGWSGYLFHLFLLLSAVTILMHLEGTLRALAGRTRWQNKFMILGLGALFASQIYASSQALLFSTLNIVLESIQAYAVLVADGLIMVSLVRNHRLNVHIYLSRTMLHSSLTALVVGLYLLTAGLLTKALNTFGGTFDLPLGTFFIFLALVGLMVVFLSDELRHHVKRFVNRHFYRSPYDYRQEWMTFTERTATVVSAEELCAVVCRMVSETFGVPAVTLWLPEEEISDSMTVGASTIFSVMDPPPPDFTEQGASALVHYMREQQAPTDFEAATEGLPQAIYHAHRECFRAGHIRYAVSLVAGQRWLGLLTLSDRHTKDAFTLEDCDLLKTMADQTAAKLLNLQLLQRLVYTKQMETFQMLSAFFVHDLKNLAAKLSLMVHNLPVHYDNPAFRDDAFHVIESSVSKMNAMCTRLSGLTHALELHRVDMDVNDLVRATLAGLNGSLSVELSQCLQPVPRIFGDPEQLQKVLENLLLNAKEALGDRGAICIETSQHAGWVILAVRDTGCGMSPNFIAQALFRPFQTTKSQGMGIGLFHSRTIVEAHDGRIEVESVEGQGSTFRVLLPVAYSIRSHAEDARTPDASPCQLHVC